ncbi:ECF transporter S component [Enterococcus sp. BWB1-3]|uniref:ECF transporter S component n=1 Tax=Enterococcus sp. BWB1-3 TaxID=2787713 RepID=UPI002ECFCFE5
MNLVTISITSLIMNKNTLWITQTAVLLALLIAVQAVTSGFGSTLLTGSLVNLLLIVSVILVDLPSGLTIALMSPFFAFMFGIGPKFWQIILCIAIGNATLVILWHLLRKSSSNQMTAFTISAVIAATAKFLVLYGLVVKLVVPIVLGIPEPNASVVSAAFSFPQLFTALIGGVLALFILPLLAKALQREI